MVQSLSQAIKKNPYLPISVASYQAKKMFTPPVFFGQNMKEAIAWAMLIAEYNSGMGLTVAAPTAGSSDILPVVLLKTIEILKKNR